MTYDTKADYDKRGVDVRRIAIRASMLGWCTAGLGTVLLGGYGALFLLGPILWNRFSYFSATAPLAGIAMLCRGMFKVRVGRILRRFV
jgi:hypothetical protein